MLIDWFTVAAQIVNFLVLVWLLKRFLYGRIIRAVDEREARIAARLADADAKAADAAGQLALYQAKLADVERERDALLAAARADAAQQHGAMIEKARELVASLEAKWREDLARERREFLLDLRRRASTEIVVIARRVIADLACMDVEHCAVRVFLEKLGNLNGDVATAFGDGQLSLCSTFEMPEDWRTEIRDAVEARFSAPVSLRFEHVPGMGVGVELRTSGWRLGWNSASYLDSLEEDVKQAFEENAVSGSVHGRTAP